MVTTNVERIPTELVEEWVQYVDPSQATSFREACAEADMQDMTPLQPFFTTWRTSLLGADLGKLKSISLDSHISSLIETIVIEDDSQKVDPYAGPGPSVDATYEIWPRNEDGLVITSKIGITDLTTILQEKRLRPKTIEILDYQICHGNVGMIPESFCGRHLIKQTPPPTVDPVSATVIAKDVLEGANLAVMSLKMDCPFVSLADSSAIHFGQPGSSLGSPATRRILIELSPEDQGQDMSFSLLRKAHLHVGPESTVYWLESLFYTATALKALKLYITAPCKSTLIANKVVAPLRAFDFRNTTTSAEEITAMLASSQESLTFFHFATLTLHDWSRWRELLALLARDYRALTSFALANLREREVNYQVGQVLVDFNELKWATIPEECRPGLNLRERGAVHNRRATGMSYSGPRAGDVLEIVARHAPIRNISFPPREGNVRRSN